VNDDTVSTPHYYCPPYVLNINLLTGFKIRPETVFNHFFSTNGQFGIASENVEIDI